MGLFEGFLLGCGGGLLPEVLALYNLREDFHSRRPRWINSWFYWLITTAMVLLGGCAVLLYLHTGTALSPVLAVHLGAGTPTLIGAFVKDRPPVEPVV